MSNLQMCTSTIITKTNHHTDEQIYILIYTVCLRLIYFVMSTIVRICMRMYVRFKGLFNGESLNLQRYICILYRSYMQSDQLR